MNQPPTPAQAEWLEKQRVAQLSDIRAAAADNTERCATCAHFYGPRIPGRARLIYCSLRPQRGTAYGHAKTKPTNTCAEWRSWSRPEDVAL